MIQLNTIYNEDCLVTMSKMDNESIDVILTSPPYNIIRPSSTDRGYDLYKDGSELSDKQTEYARKRIRQETMQLTLF